jgi:hypothetical protein
MTPVHHTRNDLWVRHFFCMTKPAGKRIVESGNIVFSARLIMLSEPGLEIVGLDQSASAHRSVNSAFELAVNPQRAIIGEG